MNLRRVKYPLQPPQLSPSSVSVLQDPRIEQGLELRARSRTRTEGGSVVGPVTPSVACEAVLQARYLRTLAVSSLAMSFYVTGGFLLLDLRIIRGQHVPSEVARGCGGTRTLILGGLAVGHPEQYLLLLLLLLLRSLLHLNNKYYATHLFSAGKTRKRRKQRAKALEPRLATHLRTLLTGCVQFWERLVLGRGASRKLCP